METVPICRFISGSSLAGEILSYGLAIANFLGEQPIIFLDCHHSRKEDIDLEKLLILRIRHNPSICGKTLGSRRHLLGRLSQLPQFYIQKMTVSDLIDGQSKEWNVRLL